MAAPVTFTESQIAELFGHEAAEDDNPDRLRRYYFKNQAFEHVTAPLPLRILVGHKGIGKSALFQVAIQEDRERCELPIEIRPDDVIHIQTTGKEFLQQIAAWKEGLRKIIADKVTSEFAIPTSDASLLSAGRQLVQTLTQMCAPFTKQYADLEPAKRAILDHFMKNKKVIVYMDDLDRGWEGQRGDIVRISALLNAVRDMARENTGLAFRIALRSDVYYLVRTSDESTDKIGGSVVWYKWTNHEILALLAKRIENYYGRSHREAALMGMAQRDLSAFLSPIMAERFLGEGKWRDAPMYRVMMSLIRRRPRDLVKLMTLAARHARDRGASRIETEHFRSVFEEYSQDRLQDTVNEYRSEFPDVQRLLIGMKPNRRERQARDAFFYTTAELLSKIRAICETGQFRDAKGKFLTPKEIAGFMYKTNFLIASKEADDGYIDRKYFDENRYVSPEIADFGYAWEVHPAYRWALQPEARDEIYRKLSLSADGG